jgi:hypothetical protein
MQASKFLYYPGDDWRRPARPEESDWYRFVPKERNANLQFREDLLAAVAENPELADEIWMACKRDILFFVNAFLFLKEPRPKRHAGEKRRDLVIPWITWGVQDWWFTEAEESFGVENVLVPKTRAAGASWKVLALFLHRWLFFDDVDLMLASKNEEKVDSPDDPSCLFAKLDFMLEHLPPFLKPKEFKRGPKRLINVERANTFIGYPSTSSLNRGGRNTAAFQDEPGDYPAGSDQLALESVRFVTDSQFIAGTFVDRAGSAWNRIALDANWPGKRLFLRWQDCPPMRAGLYTTDEGGKIKILDTDFSFPTNYPFVATPTKPGSLRSPYFDEKSAGLSAAAIARELNCDLEGATQGGFDRERVRALEKLYSQDPVCRGRLVFDYEEFEPEWIPDHAGPWLMWVKPVLNDMAGRYSIPGEDEFAMGVDVSAGFGASESVISVFSHTTGEQIAEYADSRIEPKELARLCKAAGKFFGDFEQEAFLVPEVNGFVGTSFRDEIKRIGYWNIHRRKLKQDERNEKASKKIGYYTPPEGPGAILQSLIELVGRGDILVRSKKVYDQLCQYVWKDGKIAHPGESGDDESEARNSHGDRAVAAALGAYGRAQRPRAAPTPVKPPPSYGSPEWLDRHIDDEMRAERDEVSFNF